MSELRARAAVEAPLHVGEMVLPARAVHAAARAALDQVRALIDNDEREAD